MRLNWIELTRYGNHEIWHVDLDPRPGCINILAAPNGAGKSVLRQGFSDLLFGIGAQSPMGFRYGYAGMKVMAEAVFADGREVVFGRRKGLGNTLVGADGNAADVALLAGVLGGADRALLERLFALDTHHLRQGGNQLLASGGAVADALLSGGGLGHARKLRRTLEEKADALAPARTSASRPFYAELKRLQEARRAAKEALMRPDAWIALETARDEAQAERQKANELEREAAREMSRLDRLRRVREPLGEWDRARAWLEENASAPVLPAQLAAQFSAARECLARVSQTLQADLARRGGLAKSRDAIVVDRALLDEAAEIDRLVDQAGAVRKAADDVAGLEAQRAQDEARVVNHLRRLGSVVPPDRAAELLPQQAAISRARSLIGGHAKLALAASSAREAADKIAMEIVDQTALAAALPQAADLRELAALVDEIGAQGSPSARQEERHRDTEAADLALSASLASLPSWVRRKAELLTLVVPGATELAKRDRLLQKARLAWERAGEHAAESAVNLRAAEIRLANIVAGGTIPDREAVDAARQKRDRLWQLVFRYAFAETRPTEAETAAATGGSALPLAYDRALSDADRLADRRADEAGIVEQAHAARSARLDAGRAAEAATTAQNDAALALAAAVADWRDFCAPFRLGELPELDEIRLFLAARERAVEKDRALVAAAAAETALAGQHAAWLERANQLTTQHHLSLEGALASAKARLEIERERERQHQQAAKRLAELAHEHAQETRKADRAERDFATWQIEWERAVAALDRPPGETPEVAADVLTLFGELAVDLAKLTEKTARLDGIARDRNSFAAAIAVVRRKAAPDLQGDDPIQLAGQLRKRLIEARARDREHRILSDQLGGLDAGIGRREQEHLQHSTAWRECLRDIGADNDNDALLRLALSEERARWDHRRTDTETSLLREAESVPIPALRQQLGEISADEIAGLLREAREAQTQAQLAAQEAAAKLGKLDLEMKQRATDGAYARAVADEHSAIATLSRITEDATISRLAIALLDQAREAVLASGGSAMLGRIGDHFRVLTGGAYARLITHDDDTGTVLRFVPRAFPSETCGVEGLSEGTRDQLFLALRLAAISDHVAHAPALPFIGDDILQTFDNDRAEAALRALLELSRKVQVLLLTHHRHIVDLSQRLPPDAVHICSV